MGTAGQTSVQISVKISTVLRKRLDEERSLQGETIAELVNDALKFYLDYREKRRIEYCQNYEMMRNLDLVIPEKTDNAKHPAEKSAGPQNCGGGERRSGCHPEGERLIWMPIERMRPAREHPESMPNPIGRTHEQSYTGPIQDIVGFPWQPGRYWTRSPPDTDGHIGRD